MNTPEASIGGHIASAGKKFIKGLLGKSSISEITKVVSYADTNGNPKENIPSLNGEKSHIYMGKMNEEEIGIYSDDFLRGILQYYLYCTPKGEKVTLELANCVSEVLGENMQGFMDFGKQKKYIQDFIKEKFGKRYLKKIDIIDLETRHPELFQGLKAYEDQIKKETYGGLRSYEERIKKEASQGGLGYGELDKAPSFDKLDFLESQTEPPILPEDGKPVTSLDIAKYLYRVCKTNPSFFERMKAIRPEKAKSNFYPVIEIAIRMADFLNGVDIQGGAIKQKNYDAIIREILNPYKNISEYPELGMFRDFCIKRMGDRKFETIYMDGNSKKYRTFTEKINSEKVASNKIRTYTAVVGLALLTAFGVPKYIDHQKTKKIVEQTHETINDMFKNMRVTFTSEYGGGEYTGQDKISTINQYISNIYDRFLLRYGTTGKWDEIGIKAKIADRIHNQEALDLLGGGSYGTEGCPVEDIIIDDYIITKDRSEIGALGIDSHPYARYLQYTDAFINTILLDKDFETNRDASVTMMEGRGAGQKKIVDDIGPYSPKYQGYSPSMIYIFELAQIKIGGKNYVIAPKNPEYGKFKKSEHFELYTSQGRELAIDFLRQTRPVINQVLDQYLIRYYRFYSNSLHMTEDGSFKAGKESLKSELVELLIKDFLKKGLLDKIQKDDINKIIKYLDDFVIKNNMTIKNMKLGINEKLLPNGILDEYGEAIHNTQSGEYGKEDKDKKRIENQYINSIRRAGEKDFVLEEIIGKYTASDGKTYFIGLTKINGKNFFCAREEFPKEYYSGRFYTIGCGKIVAQDYYKSRSDFLQKQTLYEKQLKSASQTHSSIPFQADPDDYSKTVKKGAINGFPFAPR